MEKKKKKTFAKAMREIAVFIVRFVLIVLQHQTQTIFIFVQQQQQAKNT